MKARRVLDKEERKACQRFIIEEIQRSKNAELTRFLKVICYILNDEFGFGKGRIEKLIDCMNKFMEKNKGNEIFWDKIDERLIDKMGLPFKPEDYEECEAFMKENNRKRNI